jgi:hypothetical protein
MGEIVMIRIHHIRRLVRILAGFVGALVALGVAAPAALARVVPPTGTGSRYAPATVVPSSSQAPVPASSHAVAAVGMPGWQIALIAVGAAIVAAVVAVLVERARSARRLRAATAT